MFIDTGDLFFKTVNYSPNMKSEIKKKAEFEAMLLSKTDCGIVTPGEKDFTLGVNQAKSLYKKAKCDVVTANIFYKNKRVFNPSVIKKIGKMKFGFIGITDPIYFQNQSEVEIKPIEEILKKEVAELKLKVDHVILLAHMNSNNIKPLMDKLSGISMVFLSHYNETANIPGKYNMIPIFQTKGEGKYVMRIDANFQKEIQTQFQMYELSDKYEKKNEISKLIEQFKK